MSFKVEVPSAGIAALLDKAYAQGRNDGLSIAHEFCSNLAVSLKQYVTEDPDVAEEIKVQSAIAGYCADAIEELRRRA